MVKVQIIDYGMGNLGSLRRSLETCGADVVILSKPEELESDSPIILPGVGSFADGSAHLQSSGWKEKLNDHVRSNGAPLLGICLGMQLLSSHGTEGGDTAGLGLIPGKVTRFKPDTPSTRIPHVGWNEVDAVKNHHLFSGVAPKSDFYFVHSYRFEPESSSDVISTTPYCGGFVSAVGRGQVYGVQFHPEKSQKPGLGLLRNFLKAAEC